MVTPGIPGQHPEYVIINIVNIGHREAQVTNIGWKAGLVKKQHALQTTSNDGLSSPLPVRLRDGEEAKYFIPLSKEKQWLKDFAKDMLLPFPKLRSYFLKIQAFTSVGDKFESRIEKGLREMIVESLKDKKGHNRSAHSNA